jgi:hypothetical protein
VTWPGPQPMSAIVPLPPLLRKLSKKQRRERALTALRVVGLADRAKHYPRQLSRVTIESGRGPYVLLDSQPVVKWVIAKAGVKEWQPVQYVAVPDDLLLGSIGRCLVLSGMRSSTVVIDEDGLWFQGKDETAQYTSVKIDRQGLNRLAPQTWRRRTEL